MAFADYDFEKHQGVSKATATALKKRFASWEQIAEALPESLLEVKGMTAESVPDLQESARAQIRQAARRKTANEERVEDRGDVTLIDVRKLVYAVARTAEERRVAKEIRDGETISKGDERVAEKLKKLALERAGQKFILSAKEADHRGADGAGRVSNIKRRRKILTDAVCDECGMDFVDKRGLGEWTTLSAETQDDLRRRVAAHKQVLHGVESKLIITGIQLDNIGNVAEDRE